MHGKQHLVVHGDLRSVSVKGLTILSPDAHHINKINVLISNQRAYLTDFGISAILDEVSGQSSVVHANIRWAAPELIRQLTDKPQKPTCESDMYSFGCVALEVSCRSREFIFG